jgi:chemotaxis-related protein WspD
LDECWHRIGGGGDGTCPELAQHIHCRNCPVYARAGTRLLNRPPPAGYRRHWAAHYARAERGAGRGEKPLALTSHRSARTSATLFRLGPEWLALDTTLFQEVTEHRPMHSLPHRQMGVVLGLVNVRGELLLCVSLRRLLEVHSNAERRTRNGEIGSAFPVPRSEFEGRRLLVVGADPNRFAFPVDEVFGVHRFHRDELESPPATVARAARPFTRGIFRWRQHTVGYLDGETLFRNLHRSLS